MLSKVDLYRAFRFIQSKLSDKEKQVIETKRPGFFQVTDRTLAIDIAAKIKIIVAGDW